MTLKIYGANGNTGELIAREARACGLTTILSGRSEARLTPLGAELALPTRAFALTSPAESSRHAWREALIISTSPAKSNLQSAHDNHLAAQSANIVICPRAGFDVVSTDCPVAQLKSARPDATKRWLGFDASQRIFPRHRENNDRIRRPGRQNPPQWPNHHVPPGAGLQTIDFGRDPTTIMPIPWSDMASGYHTTKIPNITVFTPAPPPLRLTAKSLAVFSPSATVRSFITARIKVSATGPTAAQRDASPAYVYGRAAAPGGRSQEMRFKTINGYSLTVLSALVMAEHLLSPNHQAGAFTPSALMGQDFIYRLPGTVRLGSPASRGSLLRWSCCNRRAIAKHGHRLLLDEKTRHRLVQRGRHDNPITGDRDDTLQLWKILALGLQVDWDDIQKRVLDRSDDQLAAQHVRAHLIP
jgi:short subunit dehydrogenase-like uncharacterized protein